MVRPTLDATQGVTPTFNKVGAIVLRSNGGMVRTADAAGGQRNDSFLGEIARSHFGGDQNKACQRKALKGPTIVEQLKARFGVSRVRLPEWCARNAQNGRDRRFPCNRSQASTGRFCAN